MKHGQEEGQRPRPFYNNMQYFSPRPSNRIHNQQRTALLQLQSVLSQSQDEPLSPPPSSSEVEPCPDSNSNNHKFDEYSNQPIPNSIPSPTHLSKLSNLEQEFYTMMTEFSLYTPNDISTISNPSYRALYYGVLAGSTEPKVMNAFAIIFNDLLPIRIAGRMIYKHLRNVMVNHRLVRQKENEFVQVETGLSLDAIENGRKMFMIALNGYSTTTNNNDNSNNSSSNDNNTKNGGGNGDLETTNKNKKEEEGTLTMTELIDSGIVDTIVELMEYESFDDFVQRMEQDEHEKINFQNFMIGLQKCALMKNVPITDNDNIMDSTTLCDVSCDLEEVLLVTAKRMAPIDAMKNQMTISQRKQKYSDRYDEMVQTFEEWEAIIGQPEEDEGQQQQKKMGRMGQVLAGCFAGAKNERIVFALKIVYMDYSALRVGGDLVFKLMRKLVNRRKS